MSDAVGLGLGADGYVVAMESGQTPPQPPERQRDQEDPGHAPQRVPDEPQPDNLPRFATRDILGIVVAIVGTIVLVLLAGNCEDPNVKDEGQGEAFVQFAGGCAVRYILAGGFALINLAHVVGLLLFESVGYHGNFEKFFSRLSLYGTLAAIAVSALIGPA